MTHQTRPRVIATGCGFRADTDEFPHVRVIWGDLWQLNDTFILNGVVKGFDADWLYGEEAHRLVRQGKNMLILNKDKQFFERRGVIVVRQEDCSLNAPLARYLLKNPDFKPLTPFVIDLPVV